MELGEIETVLMEADGIRGAACAVREDVPGTPRLVGYVVPGGGSPVDEERLFAHLRERLPPYMVPSLIETIPALPLLPSGKLDRGALPAPRTRDGRPTARGVAHEPTETERRILDVWGRVFHPQAVSVDDDFFLDLGGHSLLVAQAVSALRKERGFERVSVGTVYEHPTIRSLARTVDTLPWEATPAPSHPRPRAPVEPKADRRRRRLAAILQALGLYVVFGTRCLAWITPFVVFFLLLEGGDSLLVSAAWAIASEVLVLPLLLLIAVSVKWLVLGRVRPGRYPLWGRYHLRFWFAQAVVNVLPLRLMAGTPLLPFVYRLLGARIGRDVFLGTDRFGAYDVVSIGDGASINELASVNGYTIENGELVIGPISIGRGCFIGTWSVVGQDCVMDDHARLEDLSLLPQGTRVPAGETWSGSPARRTAAARRTPPPAPKRRRVRNAGIIAAYAALVSAYPVLFFLAILPSMILLAPTGLLLDPVPYVLAAPLVAGYFVAAFAALVVLAKWAVLGRVHAGRYRVHGGFYIRHWFVDHLLKDSLEFMGQVYATLYVRPWYRALGARIGRNVELSTAASISPDLVELADGSTVADEVSLGAPRVEGGWITLAPTRLGRRVFIGNSGVVPAGTTLGDRSLVGVLSIAPPNPNKAGREGASWLGSPPIPLPRRQPSAAFSEARTFRPTRRLVVARGLFELLRVTGPTAGLFLVASFVTAVTLELLHGIGAVALLVVPAIYGAACLAALGAVALAKWVVIGRYRPFTRPLWSHLVWRLEFVNALYEFFAAPIGLEALAGTPFLPMYLRLLGAKIGRGTYIETTGFLEWDLVEIGDRSVLMEDAVVQTHLFEDRVLKASSLRIGRDCSIGDASVILYDSVLEDGSRIDALSLVMKGETLPAGSAWAGVPAKWQGPARVRAELGERVGLPTAADDRRPHSVGESHGQPESARGVSACGSDD